MQKITLEEIFKIYLNTEDVIAYFKQKGMIKATPKCYICGRMMKMVRDSSVLNE